MSVRVSRVAHPSPCLVVIFPLVGRLWRSTYNSFPCSRQGMYARDARIDNSYVCGKLLIPLVIPARNVLLCR